MPETTNKSVEISSFYVLKAICAFFVICCHVPTWLAGNPIIDLAVPIFFMITGYFLYKPGQDVLPWSRSTKIAKQALSTLLLLTIIYYFVEPAPLGYHGLPVLIRWIFVSIPNRYGGPLWYLTAIFWGVLALSLFMQVFKGKHLSWLIILTTAIGLIFGRYRFLFTEEKSSYFVLSFVAYGLPCLSIGYLLHKWEARIMSWRHLTDWLVLAVLIYTLENHLLQTYSGGLSSLGPCLSHYPLCFLILAFALKYRDLGKGSLLVGIGRDYSSHIYYWHMLFVALLAHLFGYPDGGNMELPHQPYWAILVFALALLFSVLVVAIQRRLGISVFK